MYVCCVCRYLLECVCVCAYRAVHHGDVFSCSPCIHLGQQLFDSLQHRHLQRLVLSWHKARLVPVQERLHRVRKHRTWALAKTARTEGLERWVTTFSWKKMHFLTRGQHFVERTLCWWWTNYVTSSSPAFFKGNISMCRWQGQSCS